MKKCPNCGSEDIEEYYDTDSKYEWGIPVPLPRL